MTSRPEAQAAMGEPISLKSAEMAIDSDQAMVLTKKKRICR
jgi:hypothetical protein